MKDNLDVMLSDSAMPIEVMSEIRKVVIDHPVKTYDVIIENVCGTGINIVATGSLA